jgi:hypothetical protein
VVSGTVPSGRNSHVAVPMEDMRMVVFGGSSPEEGPMNDLFILTMRGEPRRPSPDGLEASSVKSSVGLCTWVCRG